LIIKFKEPKGHLHVGLMFPPEATAAVEIDYLNRIAMADQKP
jgi:hypothetical protein